MIKNQAHQHIKQINDNIMVVSKELDFRNYIMSELNEVGDNPQQQYIRMNNKDNMDDIVEDFIPIIRQMQFDLDTVLA